MKKVLAIALMGVALFGFSAGASAQGIDGGVKLGYASLSGDWGDAFDGGFSGGVFLQNTFNPNVSLQVSWLWHRHKANDDLNALTNALTSVELGTAALSDVRLTMNQFDLNAYYRFPMETVTPYLLAGVGLDYWKLDWKAIVGQFDASTDETFWDFGVNVGGGLDFAVTEQIKIGGEIIYTYVFDEYDDGFFNFLATGSYGFSTGM